MTRLYGRSPIGTRCVDRTPHGHWKTTTMLSAIRLDGVIRDATVIFDGTWQRIHDKLREKVRRQVGKKPTPWAAALDSQSVNTNAPQKGAATATTRA